MSDVNDIISEEAKKNIKNDIFSDLDNYNNVMTISQVVKYFSRHGMDSFTKTMIQNYVRVNVLPQPENKRHYANNHLFMLAIIDGLKNTFSLDDIKAFFAIENGNSEINGNIYNLYLKFLEEYNGALAEIITEHEPDKTEELLIRLMAKSASYKQMAESIMERHS